MIAPTLPVSATENPIERLLATVSASRLGTFHQCRLKFYFRYVLQIKKAKTPALHVGSSVHSVLQEWNMRRWQKFNFYLAGLREYFEKQWAESQVEEKVAWDKDDSEEESKLSAWDLLETYFNSTPIPPDERPEAVEVRVDADLANHGLPVLVGVIDLVREGGKIVDFKTAGQTPNAEKAGHLHELQVNCYSVLYRDCTRKRESGVELHHLVKLKNPKLVVTALPPMTDNQETRLLRIIESYVAGVQREDWVPSPSIMSCACCEFFNECRRFY